MTIVARVASLIFNQALMAETGAAEILVSSLAGRFDIEPLTEVDASRFVGKPAGPRDSDGNLRPMYRVDNSVAIVSLIGELVNRGAWVGASSGLVSYEGFGAQLDAIEADPNVRGVVLDMNTPGGHAAGAVEAATHVRRLAAKKPVIAFVNAQAASAGYVIAAGASKIVTTPSGLLGSIGVIWLHLDRSEQIAKAGVKPTIFKKGAFKADGNAFNAIPADAAGRINASLDAAYDLLVETVASLRPMTADAVRATEAGVFMGQQAVDAGLADKVGDLTAALALARSELNGQAFRSVPSVYVQNSTGRVMKMETTYTQAQFDAAVTEASAKGKADGMKAGVDAERARIGAILGHDSAKGREAQAQHFAFKTDMAPEDAAAALAAAPLAAKADEKTPLARAMEQSDQPNLGPGGERTQGKAPAKAISTSDIYARRAAEASGKHARR